MLAPVFAQADRKFDETDARNRLILIALKIRGYRLRHGSLPASLDPLGIDSSLLIDPYTGGRFLYKPQGADYLLYSVGPDLKDDGGVPADESPNTSPNTNGVPRGDYGVRAFWTKMQNASSITHYRRVPHMKPPKLKPGSPPLPE